MRLRKGRSVTGRWVDCRTIEGSFEAGGRLEMRSGRQRRDAHDPTIGTTASCSGLAFQELPDGCKFICGRTTPSRTLVLGCHIPLISDNRRACSGNAPHRGRGDG